MMDTKTIQKNYDTLTVNERFSLLVQANQRGDEKEAAALKRTDPKWGFSVSSMRGLMDAFNFLVEFYMIEQLHNVAMYYHMLVNWENITISLESGEAFNGTFDQVKIDILTYSEAFKEICKEFGVDPERMLSPWAKQTTHINFLVIALQKMFKDDLRPLAKVPGLLGAFRWLIEEKRKEWE
ncbi:MAG: hypothetical protein H7Y59_20660 [Anaerolineales bacterium]|nr:hypothetical protein [Anaerolineales bacterium]